MNYTTKCGCIVIETPPNFRIEYCPKHKAADALYDALKDVKIVFDNMSVSRRVTIAPLITDVNLVLAKV